MLDSNQYMSVIVSKQFVFVHKHLTVRDWQQRKDSKLEKHPAQRTRLMVAWSRRSCSREGASRLSSPVHMRNTRARKRCTPSTLRVFHTCPPPLVRSAASRTAFDHLRSRFLA